MLEAIMAYCKFTATSMKYTALDSLIVRGMIFHFSDYFLIYIYLWLY